MKGEVLLSNTTGKKKNNELLQLLLSVFIIGLFVMMEVWLIFFYCSRYGYDNSTFLFPFIFGILTILMVCINTMNIYQIFVRRTAAGGVGSDKKAEYIIYKQVKSLPDTFNDQLEALSAEFEKTQKKTARAILMKMDEQIKQMKEELDLSAAAPDNSAVLEQIAEIKADIDGIKLQIEEISRKNENISNLITESSADYEKMKENFPVLQNEHKKVFELLGSVAFRNDEIKDMLDNLTKVEMEIKSEADSFNVNETSYDESDDTVNDLFAMQEEPAGEEIEESANASEDDLGISFADLGDDPNKQLSPDEIAALFANV